MFDLLTIALAAREAYLNADNDRNVRVIYALQSLVRQGLGWPN